MKVNLRKNLEKEKRPSTSSTSTNTPSSIDEFRLYINNLESLLRDTINENVKLKMQINDLSAKKNQIDLKKLQTKADELIKRYSKGKTYLNDIEKKLIQKPPLKELNKIITENPNGDNKMQGIINEYESQIEEILESKSQLQSKLNASEKEKEDLQTKFREEFMLMSSVIYNLGFLYWSMKSEYEDKLKSNKGWLETERIKQYNGDY